MTLVMATVGGWGYSNLNDSTMKYYLLSGLAVEGTTR